MSKSGLIWFLVLVLFFAGLCAIVDIRAGLLAFASCIIGALAFHVALQIR